MHSQLEDLRIYFVQPQSGYPAKSLKMTKAHHIIAGYKYKIGKSSRLKLELFYQKLFDVPVIADSSFSMINFVQDWTFNETLINQGEGINKGVELTLERFLDAGYYYLLTGTLYDSRYKGGDGVWHNSRFDQHYAFNLLAGKEFEWGNGNRIFGLNGRVSVVGGERHNPVDQQASRAREQVEFDEQHAFSKSFANRVVADLSLTYRINRRKHSSIWALQVKNVLLTKDQSLDYNFKTNRVQLVEEGSPLPVLSYKIEF